MICDAGTYTPHFQNKFTGLGRASNQLNSIVIFEFLSNSTRVGKSRFTILSTQKFILLLLFIFVLYVFPYEQL